MPEAAGAGPHPLLVLLHGRGADEEDLLSLAPVLDERLLVLSVRAPQPFEGGGYTWYDLGGPVGQPEQVSFAASSKALMDFLQVAVAGYPVDPGRVFLFGFSMGAVMSLALSLTRPELFRGVCAHSGYVPEGVPIRWDALAGPEYFLLHGTEDPVIPVVMARRAQRLFAASNARFFYREYPMQHQISEESLSDIREWIHRLLNP
jgi:phospholipase/carboxylesterase